ncbi:free fatty acid receptor 2-like [Gastrophryne carolinensis]
MGEAVDQAKKWQFSGSTEINQEKRQTGWKSYNFEGEAVEQKLSRGTAARQENPQTKRRKRGSPVDEQQFTRRNGRLVGVTTTLWEKQWSKREWRNSSSAEELAQPRSYSSVGAEVIQAAWDFSTVHLDSGLLYLVSGLPYRVIFQLDNLLSGLSNIHILQGDFPAAGLSYEGTVTQLEYPIVLSYPVAGKSSPRTILQLQFGYITTMMNITAERYMRSRNDTMPMDDSGIGSFVLDGQHNHLVLAIYILTFMTGLPSNLLAFYAFLVKVRKKPSPVDILLLNLTISDLILLMFLPLKMKEVTSNMAWDMPQFLCPLTGFCYFSSIYISTLFLTAVSVERYLGVAFPIKYKLNRKPQYAVFASIVFWLLACGHCSIVYIIQYCVPNNHTNGVSQRCYEDFSQEQLRILLPVRLELGVALFFIPSIITLFCYINFIRILTSLPNIQKKRKQRAICLAIATLVNFCICFAPYNISHIVGFIMNQSPQWRVDSLLLSTFNASLDPVVFYFTSTTVQKTFFDFLTAILKKIGNICPCKKLCPPPKEPSFSDSNIDRSFT